MVGSDKRNDAKLLKKYFTLNGLAKYLGVKRETVYSAVRSGNLKPVLLGDGVRVVPREEGKQWNKTRPGHGGRPNN